jgi:hypothetical protein
MPRKKPPKPQRRSKPAPMGFNDAPHNWTAENAARAASTGASIARVAVDPQVLAERGFEAYDQTIADIKGQGLKPMIVIPSNTTKSGKDWKRTVASIAKQYRGSQFQIGNEPNNPAFGGVERTKEYLRGLRQAEKVIHKSRPRADVIAAGAAPMQGANRYNRKVSNAIEGRDIGMAAHIYADSVKGAKKAYDRIDRKTDNPVYVTEAGFSSAEMSPEVQARRTQRLHQALSRRGAESISYHSLMPGDGGEGTPNPTQAGYSFFDEAGNPKPVATSFQQRAQRRNNQRPQRNR